MTFRHLRQGKLCLQLRYAHLLRSECRAKGSNRNTVTALKADLRRPLIQSQLIRRAVRRGYQELAA